MYVDINTTQGESGIRDTDNLKSFSVRTDASADRHAIEKALGPLGRLGEDSHAWIEIAELRLASGRSEDAEWVSEFDAMVAYAESKGWVNQAGTALRAHIENV